jgi:nicotinamidase-related amidase
MASNVPPLPEQWNTLDFNKIFSEHTAFVSISQCNSLFSPKGVQGGERQWERGTIEKTITVAKACREAGMKFFWIGYNVFRDHYSMTDLDRAQYGYWSKVFNSANMTEEEKQWDVSLVDELKALQQPEDIEFFEYAHQSAMVGTPFKPMLARMGIKTIIICGIHMDWCIEGNARAARDEGLIPIVIGDACSCKDEENDIIAMQRISSIVCPVLSADEAARLIREATARS